MKNFTAYPETVFKCAYAIHLAFEEDKFYETECQVDIDENQVIEWICELLFDTYAKTGENKITNEVISEIARELIVKTVFASLKKKGLVDSLEVDEKEVAFLTKEGKEVSENLRRAA